MIGAVFLLISITTAIRADKTCLEDPKQDRLILKYTLAALGPLMQIATMTPKEINVSFLLFTRENGENYQIIKATNVSTVKDSSFDPNKNTSIYIHGYNSDPTDWAIIACKKTLKVDDVNCVCVNWKDGAKDNYVRAVLNAPVVGAAVSCFIITVAELFGSYDGSRVHIIGHSLGCHICGQSARIYTKRTHVLIRKVTALDPAGPLMGDYNNMRLKPTDAACVEAYYTDNGPFFLSLFSSGYGTNVVCGKINVYPNGGKKQPGCPRNIVNATIQNLQNIPACNHAFSYLLYMASMERPFVGYSAPNYDAFQKGIGFPCSTGSCTLLGYNTDSCSSSNKTTFLYFNTGADLPYIRFRVKVQISLQVLVITRGDLHVTFNHGSGETENYPIYSGDLHTNTHVAHLDVQQEAPPETVTVTCNTDEPSNVKIPQVTLQYGHNSETYNYCAQNPEDGGASRTLLRCG